MKTIVITGSRKGIGKALAEHYLNDGWRVAGCSPGILPHTQPPSRLQGRHSPYSSKWWQSVQVVMIGFEHLQSRPAKIATGLLQVYYSPITSLLQLYYRSITPLLQVYYRPITGLLND